MPSTAVTADLFLGIDMGTSACRVMAIDGDGAVAGQSSAPLPPPQRNGRHVEQQASLWWIALTAAVAQLGAQVPLRHVRALAVDGTSGTLLLVNVHGDPVTPALMYNDTRSSAEALRISAVAPPDSGAHGATSALAKLLYLQRRYALPHGWRAMHQADWIIACLCGHVGVSDENNALKLGYDPVTRGWPTWVVGLVGDRESLPEVVPPGTPLAPVTASVAKALNLDADVRVIAGTTDSVAAFIASGAAQPGEAVTSLGSTLVLKIISPTPVYAAEFGVYSHRLGEQWLVGGASNSGGAVLRQFFNDGELETLSMAIRTGVPSGLDYYPLTAPGERFPVNDPSLPPRLTPRPHEPALFLQGMLEGIAKIELQGYRCLARLGAPYPVSVRSVGGGARNEAWSEIRRGMLGVPLIDPLSREAAYGAALLSRDGYIQLQ